MTWYADLAHCDYFPFAPPALRAIGWLERGKPFTTGKVQPGVYEALRQMETQPWEPVHCMGWHTCDLCLREPRATGVKNLFIPGDGVIYVFPDLVTHYVSLHHYQPPECFCEAVLKCPPIGSEEYLQALAQNGGHRLVQVARGETTCN
jgi:hypothetical protein